MNRRNAAALTAILGLALGVGLWWMTRPPPPNVVVVLGCTLRRDQLTPYGGHAEASPFLNEVRNSGTMFADLVASSSWTKESSTAIFTGHQAATVGMTEPLKRHSKRILPERLTTLAEHLERAGYDTFGVTANPHLNSSYGFDQGFDEYRDTSSRGFAIKNKIAGKAIVARGLELLDARPENSENPFYMQLVLIDPHQPTKVGPKLTAPFEGPDVPPRLAEYRANVRRVDDALRALDRGLQKRGYTPENTLFVLVADHGEGLSLPQHHRQQHGRVLYPTLTSVPWILRGPGVAEAHTVTGLASHLDFLPTILDIAGVEAAELEAPELEGHSWALAVAGWWSTTSRERAFTETWYFGANRAAVVTEKIACERDWGSVAIPNDTFVDGCFDRADDPGWAHPIDPHPELQDELDAWRAWTQAAYELAGAAEDAKDAVGTREQLKALGYVED